MNGPVILMLISARSCYDMMLVVVGMVMVMVIMDSSLTLPSSAVSLMVAYMFTETLQCGRSSGVL